MTDPSHPSPDAGTSDKSSHPAARDIPLTLADSTATVHWSTAPDPFPRPFGRYILQKELGRGGMGIVYLAQDPALDILVSLKVPHPEVAADAAALERFYREARAAARLAHPHICRIYDVGISEGQHYLAMAYVEGDPLSEHIGEFAADPGRTAVLVRTIALAVEEAHRHGIIHRDLKPANVMIEADGQPVVMDFGLARRVETRDASQTREGVILGTPAYMPPEQAAGNLEAIGPRSDVYSLGVILYELLTGRQPFRGTTTAVLVSVMRDEPPRPSSLRPEVDPFLEAVCLKAMAKEPSQRYGSMADFAAALADYRPGKGFPEVAAPVSVAGLLAETALKELRTWGWERGLDNLRTLLPAVEGADPETAALLLAWLGGDPDKRGPALERLGGDTAFPALTAWGLACRAFALVEAYSFARAKQAVEEAAAVRRPSDPLFDATLALLRGTLLVRHGGWDEAVPLLHQALALFGREHFMTGRVLDQLGRVYAGKCNFDAAHEFYSQAILCKTEAGDEPGLVVSHEETGRLLLDWGRLDRAEEVLQDGLRLAQRLGDDNGQAQMFNHLGRIFLLRGEHEAALGRKAAARRHWGRAAEYLDWCIRHNERQGRIVQEGRARKDAALCRLSEGDREGAAVHLNRAEELLRQAGFERGLAEVQRVLARLRGEEGAHDKALRLLRQALTHYDAAHQRIEATRTQLEIARMLAASSAVARVVTEALQDALHRAESCRRGDLVEAVEEELRDVDEEAHWRHVFRRVRGHGAPEATASLSSGTSEPATVLFLNLHGFVPFCQGLDPEQVMLTLNQLLADLEGALERAGAQVTAYLGGGLMALLRGANHAERGVGVALDLLRVLAEFNLPREVLGLRQLPARVGVASGMVFLGNIGTYRKMEFTAVGPAVNLAALLMRQADETAPCVSQETRELAGDRFLYREGGPRLVELPGIGMRQAWDVVGRVAKQPSGMSLR